MKLKHDFVTNSSSTSYIIDVMVDKLSADDFLLQLLSNDLFRSKVEYYDNIEKMEQNIILIKQELESDYDFPLNKGSHDISFGDEDGTIIGCILDYCLRNDPQCSDFKVEFNYFNR